MKPHWKKVKLGEVVDIQNGYAFKSKDFDDNYGTPVIKIKNVASGKVKMESVQYYPFDINSFEKYVIKKDDILIAMTGSHPDQPSSIVGKVSRYKSNDISLMNQRVGKIYSKELNIADNNFLFWFLTQPEITHQLAHRAGGSANQANISPKIIKSLSLNLPPLSEQKAIARILGSLDDKIELNRQMNRTLEDMAQAIFKAWFVDFEPFKDSNFIDSEMGKIPEGWTVEKAENVAHIAIGKTPPRKEHEWFTKNPKDIKWISIKDLGKSGIFINDSSEYLTKKSVEKFNIKLIPSNCVVLSFKLTIGRVAITDEIMTSNEAIAHFKLDKTGLIKTNYLYLYLKNFNYDSLGSTSSIAKAVNSKTIKSMPILVPSKKIINQFDDRVKLLLEKIKINQNEIETLTHIRDTLLPKLLSGEIGVN